MALYKIKMSILGADAGAEVMALPHGQRSPFRSFFCCPWTLPAPLGAKRLSGLHPVWADSCSAGVLLNGGCVCLLRRLCDLSFARLNTLINSLVFSVRCYVLGEREGSAEASFPIPHKQAVSFLPHAKQTFSYQGKNLTAGTNCKLLQWKAQTIKSSNWFFITGFSHQVHAWEVWIHAVHEVEQRGHREWGIKSKGGWGDGNGGREEGVGRKTGGKGGDRKGTGSWRMVMG